MPVAPWSNPWGHCRFMRTHFGVQVSPEEATMIEFLKSLGATPLQWGEPDDDGESYALVFHGELIRASSEALALREVLSRLPQPIRLAA